MFLTNTLVVAQQTSEILATCLHCVVRRHDEPSPQQRMSSVLQSRKQDCQVIKQREVSDERFKHSSRLKKKITEACCTYAVKGTVEEET
jgi:hypothetical protein